MGFPELRSFHDPDLKLPINGKVYTIKSPTAAEGVRLRLFFYDPEKSNVTGLEQLSELTKILGATWNDTTERYEGGVWSEMEKDGVTYDDIVRAGETALIRYGMTLEAAEKHWAQEMLSPNFQPPTTGAKPVKKAAAKKAAPKAATK